MNAKTILIVEDDDGIAGLIVETIEHETPHVALRVPDGLRAEKVMGLLIPDLLVLDYDLPLLNGIELYDRIHGRKEYEDVPAFMLTAFCKVCMNDAKKRRLPCLRKPFGINDFLNTVETLIT